MHNLNDSHLKADLVQAREEYFRAADSALEKVRLRFGSGRDSLLNLLSNKNVENFPENNPRHD